MPPSLSSIAMPLLPPGAVASLHSGRWKGKAGGRSAARRVLPGGGGGGGASSFTGNGSFISPNSAVLKKRKRGVVSSRRLVPNGTRSHSHGQLTHSHPLESNSVRQSARPMAGVHRRAQDSYQAELHGGSDKGKIQTHSPSLTEGSTYILLDVLNRLSKKDPRQIFAYPVDPAIAPDYKSIIRSPMDFHTIRERILRHEYKDAATFDNDIRLIVSNCCTYNAPNTVFFKAALTIEDTWKKMREKTFMKFMEAKNREELDAKLLQAEAPKSPVVLEEPKREEKDAVGIMKTRGSKRRMMPAALEDKENEPSVIPAATRLLRRAQSSRPQPTPAQTHTEAQPPPQEDAPSASTEVLQSTGPALSDLLRDPGDAYKCQRLHRLLDAVSNPGGYLLDTEYGGEDGGARKDAVSTSSFSSSSASTSQLSKGGFQNTQSSSITHLMGAPLQASSTNAGGGVAYHPYYTGGPTTNPPPFGGGAVLPPAQSRLESRRMRYVDPFFLVKKLIAQRDRRTFGVSRLIPGGGVVERRKQQLLAEFAARAATSAGPGSSVASSTLRTHLADGDSSKGFNTRDSFASDAASSMTPAATATVDSSSTSTSGLCEAGLFAAPFMATARNFAALNSATNASIDVAHNFATLNNAQHTTQRSLVSPDVDSNLVSMEYLSKDIENYGSSLKSFVGDCESGSGRAYDYLLKHSKRFQEIISDSESTFSYAPFNDLRLFGIDTDDHMAFNANLRTQNDYLLGVGENHLRSVLSLSKEKSPSATPISFDVLAGLVNKYFHKQQILRSGKGGIVGTGGGGAFIGPGGGGDFAGPGGVGATSLIGENGFAKHTGLPTSSEADVNVAANLAGFGYATLPSDGKGGSIYPLPGKQPTDSMKRAPSHQFQVDGGEMGANINVVSRSASEVSEISSGVVTHTRSVAENPPFWSMGEGGERGVSAGKSVSAVINRASGLTRFPSADTGACVNAKHLSSSNYPIKHSNAHIFNNSSTNNDTIVNNATATISDNVKAFSAVPRLMGEVISGSPPSGAPLNSPHATPSMIDVRSYYPQYMHSHQPHAVSMGMRAAPESPSEGNNSVRITSSLPAYHQDEGGGGNATISGISIGSSMGGDGHRRHPQAPSWDPHSPTIMHHPGGWVPAVHHLPNRLSSHNLPQIPMDHLKSSSSIPTSPSPSSSSSPGNIQTTATSSQGYFQDPHIFGGVFSDHLSLGGSNGLLPPQGGYYNASTASQSSLHHPLRSGGGGFRPPSSSSQQQNVPAAIGLHPGERHMQQHQAAYRLISGNPHVYSSSEAFSAKSGVVGNTHMGPSAVGLGGGGGGGSMNSRAGAGFYDYHQHYNTGSTHLPREDHTGGYPLSFVEAVHAKKGIPGSKETGFGGPLPTVGVRIRGGGGYAPPPPSEPSLNTGGLANAYHYHQQKAAGRGYHDPSITSLGGGSSQQNNSNSSSGDGRFVKFAPTSVVVMGGGLGGAMMAIHDEGGVGGGVSSGSGGSSSNPLGGAFIDSLLVDSSQGYNSVKPSPHLGVEGGGGGGVAALDSYLQQHHSEAQYNHYFHQLGNRSVVLPSSSLHPSCRSDGAGGFISSSHSGGGMMLNSSHSQFEGGGGGNNLPVTSSSSQQPQICLSSPAPSALSPTSSSPASVSPLIQILNRETLLLKNSPTPQQGGGDGGDEDNRNSSPPDVESFARLDKFVQRFVTYDG